MRCNCSCNPAGGASVIGACECGDSTCRAADEMCRPCWSGQCCNGTGTLTEVEEARLVALVSEVAKAREAAGEMVPS